MRAFPSCQGVWHYSWVSRVISKSNAIREGCTNNFKKIQTGRRDSTQKLTFLIFCTPDTRVEGFFVINALSVTSVISRVFSVMMVSQVISVISSVIGIISSVINVISSVISAVTLMTSVVSSARGQNMPFRPHFSFIPELTSWVHQGVHKEYISRVSPF